MAKKAKKQSAEQFARNEALCRRCGRCCFEKVRFGELVVITDIPCRHLDLETNMCAVYENRFKAQALCTSAEHSREIFALPGDCPYVGGDSDYPAPEFLVDHPEYENAVNALFPGRKEGLLRTVKPKGRK